MTEDQEKFLSNWQAELGKNKVWSAFSGHDEPAIRYHDAIDFIDRLLAAQREKDADILEKTHCEECPLFMFPESLDRISGQEKILNRRVEGKMPKKVLYRAKRPFKKMLKKS